MKPEEPNRCLQTGKIIYLTTEAARLARRGSQKIVRCDWGDHWHIKGERADTRMGRHY